MSVLLLQTVITITTDVLDVSRHIFSVYVESCSETRPSFPAVCSSVHLALTVLEVLLQYTLISIETSNEPGSSRWDSLPA